MSDNKEKNQEEISETTPAEETAAEDVKEAESASESTEADEQPKEAEETKELTEEIKEEPVETEESVTSDDDEKSEEAVEETTENEPDALNEFLSDEKEPSTKIYYENMEPTEEAVATPKKSKFKMPVIIGSLVIGFVLIAALTWFLITGVFLNTSIEGSWRQIIEVETTENATDDQVNEYFVYFIFEKDGTFIYTNNNEEGYGSYVVSEDNSAVSLVLSDGTQLEAEISVTGNMIQGRALSILISGETEPIELYSDKYTPYEIDPIDDFKINEKIVDTWIDKEYGQKIELTADGKLILTGFNVETGKTTNILRASYSILEETKISIKVANVADDSSILTLDYGYDEDNDSFVFSGIGFVRESASEEDK